MNDVDRLTARQKDVVRLLGEGMSRTQMSEALGLSYGTINTHISQIYAVLRVNSRVECLRKVYWGRELMGRT